MDCKRCPFVVVISNSIEILTSIIGSKHHVMSILDTLPMGFTKYTFSWNLD